MCVCVFFFWVSSENAYYLRAAQAIDKEIDDHRYNYNGGSYYYFDLCDYYNDGDEEYTCNDVVITAPEISLVGNEGQHCGDFRVDVDEEDPTSNNDEEEIILNGTNGWGTCHGSRHKRQNEIKIVVT